MQLVQQFRYAIRTGTLRPGAQLPPARVLVSSLALNPNTILKAYAELEHSGLVTTRPGLGTFVADTVPPPIDALIHGRLRRSLAAWVAAARKAGMDPDAAHAMFTEAIAASFDAQVA
jgi:GntR family transcriptional regulator